MFEVFDATDGFGIDVVLVEKLTVVRAKGVNLGINELMELLTLKAADFLGGQPSYVSPMIHNVFILIYPFFVNQENLLIYLIDLSFFMTNLLGDLSFLLVRGRSINKKGHTLSVPLKTKFTSPERLIF